MSEKNPQCLCGCESFFTEKGFKCHFANQEKYGDDPKAYCGFFQPLEWEYTFVSTLTDHIGNDVRYFATEKDAIQFWKNSPWLWKYGEEEVLINKRTGKLYAKKYERSLQK